MAEEKLPLDVPKKTILVSNAALAEIRIDICDGLQADIDLTLEAAVSHDEQVVHRVQPAVTWLRSICEENHFLE